MFPWVVTEALEEGEDNLRIPLLVIFCRLAEV
jgi:hypothetical protein